MDREEFERRTRFSINPRVDHAVAGWREFSHSTRVGLYTRAAAVFAMRTTPLYLRSDANSRAFHLFRRSWLTDLVCDRAHPRQRSQHDPLLKIARVGEMTRAMHISVLYRDRVLRHRVQWWEKRSSSLHKSAICQFVSFLFSLNHCITV